MRPGWPRRKRRVEVQLEMRIVGEVVPSDARDMDSVVAFGVHFASNSGLDSEFPLYYFALGLA